MFRIITISREFGSGGTPIGERLTRRLGWKLVDDPLVSEIAQSAQVSRELAARLDERVDPWYHRLVKAISRGGFEAAHPSAGPEPFDAEAMAALWDRVILEAALLGHCVIVGRGGQCLLQDRRDAFHVSVHASAPFKLRLIAERFPHLPDPGAAMHATDARRAAYIRQRFDRDWTDRQLYHLVVDAAIGLDEAAAAILAAAGLTPAAS